MSKTAPSAGVCERLIATHGARLNEKAICLTTPVPSLVPLAAVEPPPGLSDLLAAYEPRVAQSGLYAHQAAVIKELKKPRNQNIVMTTATGSGKSLAFWSWGFHLLARDDAATVIATFPTQALLWGQAKRLAAMSAPGSLVEFRDLEGACFAGVIESGETQIPWSVWYGVQNCEFMRGHEGSPEFADARLRLCTLDKIHWSLMRDKEEGFLSRLAGVIVDEAHSWHGLSGANVRSMFDRLRLSMDVLGRRQPSFFLSSATLAAATEFAEDLTGAPAISFVEIEDRGVSKASVVPTADVPKLLAVPAEPGLLRRYVLLLESEPTPISAESLLANPDLLGPDANALCFVQSKFLGHRMRQDLERALPARDVVMYDGDLPAKQRRLIEHELFKADGKSRVLVGTSAIELGVDLPALDVVVMDDLPPRRCELLQRLGRVGRSPERPGLAILCLGYSPGDERLIDDPLAALSAENIKSLPLPLHLDLVRLRAISAAFEEWRWRLKKRKASWDDFNAALERHFGYAPTIAELKERCEEVLGDVIDLDEGSWFYKGFRISASQGKRKLILDGTGESVAEIEDISIFRDAHPEGVYLGHGGASYRVQQYVGDWDIGAWASPSGVVLNKFMKGLRYIVVRAEEPTVATRGRWRDQFILVEKKTLPEGHDGPVAGQLEFGVFTFLRKFDGYQEIDLRHRGEPRLVSLAEIAARFNDARDAGKSFPFLHNFSHRTKGWKWVLDEVLTDPAVLDATASVLGPLLQSFFCDAVECSRNDLQVTLEAESGELRVVDGTPGGNGLSEALLQGSRVSTALRVASNQVAAQGQRSADGFRHYLAEECRLDSNLTADEIVAVIDQLATAWNGSST